MKKLICLILGILMAVGCFGALAESGETAFLQIKEDVTANVYENPGDAAPADTLESETICGLLEETAGEAGEVWYRIFYLSSEKKGKVGYIRAEDAEKLSEEELTALLTDPDKLNQVLDLIDAVNDYLKTQETGNIAQTDTETKTNTTGKETEQKTTKQFYTTAMEKLQQVFSALGSVDLSGTVDASKEMADKVKEAGTDLADGIKGQVKIAKMNVKDQLDDAKDRIENIDLQETLNNAKDKVKDIDLKEKLEGVKEKLESIDLKEKLEDVKDQLENSKLNDRISELKDQLENSGLTEKLDGLKETFEGIDLKEKVSGLTDILDGFSLRDKVEDVESIVNELRNEESDLRQSVRSVTDIVKQLIDNND